MSDSHPLLFNSPPRWRRQRPVRGLSIELTRWLFDPGSLTRRLRQCCAQQFRVGVLWQGWSRPGRDEAQALRLRLDAWAWTREVRLFCDERPWVFARTLIPAATLRGRGRDLTRLGNRPLGDVLFTTPGVRRGPVEVARIAPGQRLHQRALADPQSAAPPLWARRSLFYLDQQPLLVCEIFLPDLPASPPFADRICFHLDLLPALKDGDS